MFRCFPFSQEKGKHINNLTHTHFRDNPAKLFMFIGFFLSRPVWLGLSGRNSGKIPERPRKRSQSVSWNFPREYGWDAPSPIIQGILRLPERFQNSLPQYGWGRLFFSDLVPERASQSWSWNSQQYWVHVIRNGHL